jgi:hypothetical protein
MKKDRDEKGRFLEGNSQSFKEHPERINPNGAYFDPEESITFQYNRLIRLSVKEFEKWRKEHPKKERTMAQEVAYNAVVQARIDLPYLKEVTDRTEGKAPQSLDLTSQGDKLNTFDDDQIDKIAKRIASRERSDGGSSS